MIKKILIGLFVVVLALVAYYVYQFNGFAKGVIEDKNMMENFVRPDSFNLTDTTVMRIGGDSTEIH